ncbi:FK506-binding protein 5 [Uranotaenia lowii]|uniref:FK506-binding protein 5 n=1 Tax=Uranotaenia lowii TaxID=190385 RepID=UPI00247A7787|nr:FK506-binding protein 5 [Uranotaenia lowii]
MIDNDEDEDDYEGYFLRPANEYNIKEKIKIANQESFAIPTPPSPKFIPGERRVTFREQLVDYEPDEYSEAEEEDPVPDNGSGGAGPGSFAVTNGIHNDDSESSPELNDRAQSKNAAGDMDEVDEDIIEELSINDTAEEEVVSGVEKSQDEEEQEAEEEEEEHEEQEEEQGEDEELEEEVTESSLDTEIHNPETSEDSSSPTKARASEDGSGSGDNPELINYSDDSQNDEENSEERRMRKEELMKESLSYSDADKSEQANEYDDEGEEDDEEATEERDDDDTSDDSPVLAHLRKRAEKCQRKCCRHKKRVNDKLPYYNGFHSEYGLSRDELIAKQKRVEAKKQRFHERTQKKIEEQQIKAQTNEEAFASWLNKKLKNSLNKYHNMYDYKGKKHKKRFSKADTSSIVLAELVN